MTLKELLLFKKHMLEKATIDDVPTLCQKSNLYVKSFEDRELYNKDLNLTIGFNKTTKEITYIYIPNKFIDNVTRKIALSFDNKYKKELIHKTITK